MFRSKGSRRLLVLALTGCLAALFQRTSAQQAAFFIDFDGTNDYLQVADADSLSFGNGAADMPFTVETWLRPDVMNAKQNLVGKWSDGANLEYRLYIAANTIRMDLRDGSSQATVSAYTAVNMATMQGSWHHLAVTYDGRGGPVAANGITFYVDGAPVALARENHAAYVAMENSTASVQIGREGPNYKQYNGAMDELRMWNVARTPAQIVANMTSELPGAPPGLVAYWKFNEGSGTVANDAATGIQTATLFNGPTWTSGGPVTPSDPDLTAPEIANISEANLTASGITISFTTSEPATGWVSLTATGACPCTDVYSQAIATSHVVSVTGLAPDTFYTYEVRASDAAGNLAVGPTMSFRTLVQQDNVPPTVSISSPPAGTVSGTVVISAEASDNAGVAGVQFLVDGVPFGAEDLAAPYTIAWDTNTVADGAHTIAAQASDAANNVGSASVSVTVANAQPPATEAWHLDFDGVNDYVNVADADGLSFGNGASDTPFTIEMWFKPDVVGVAKQNLLTKWGESSNQEYRLYIASNNIRLDLRDNSSQATVSAYPAAVQTALSGGWHHLAITYDGRGGSTAANGITFFIDGAAVAVSRENHPAYVAMENLIAPLQIGREGPSYKQYNGAIDELRLWNVMRSAGQLQAQLTTELPPAQSGLAAYWKFNDASGTAAVDDGPGAYTAILFNGTAWAAGGPMAAAATQAPDITSPASAVFEVGESGSFAITSTGNPAPTLSVSGALPDGVTFASGTDGNGSLQGTPLAGTTGVYPLTITATNGVGTPDTQSFSLTVNQPPAITSAASGSVEVGVAASITATASGFPVPSLSASGALPAGISFSDNGNGTGVFTGTPAAGSGGTYAITLTANNGVGSPASQSFTLSVTQAPSITSGASVTFPIGVPATFTVTTTGTPLPAISASGMLPAGMTFSDLGNGTANFSGTPGSGGTFPLILTATNGVGAAAVQNLTLTVSDCVLSPASGALAAGIFQMPYSTALAATGTAPHTFVVTAGVLPGGLALSNEGVLAGMPATTGSFAFSVTATSSTGCTASQAYTILVTPDAQDESFGNGVGNTQFSVGAGTPSTPAVVVSGTVLSNDQGPGTLTAGPAIIATAQGGQVAMSALGTFLYTPPAGFAGPSDSFTYALTDGNGAVDTAVVTINLGGIVWYVNGSAAAGDGRSQSPFNSLTAASAAAQDGHVLYVHAGSAGGAAALKPNQTLWGAGSLFTLNGLSIAAATAPALAGTVTLANNVLVQSVSINGGASAAIAGDGLTGAEVINGVSIVGGATGLDLTNVGGSLSVVGGSITGVTSGSDVRIIGGSGNIAVGAAITNSGGRSVEVQQRTGGTITFSGPINDTGSGILLNANGGSSVAFEGGLTLSTGANAAFTATGGGVVTVAQNEPGVVNTISTLGGVALQVSQTEIGAAGLTFRRISAGSAAASPGAAIILDDTGTGATNGGLTVTGTGAAQSGGVIRRKTGPDGSLTQGVGIYLNNTKNVSLSWMDLSRFDNAGILGRNVSGFYMGNSIIADAGTNTSLLEGPIVFGAPGPGGADGLVGQGILRDTVISGGIKDSVSFFNRSGVMNLTVERTTGTPGQCQIGFNSTVTGGHGLVVQLESTAVGTVTVNRCRFRDVRSTSLVASASGDASLTLLVTGSATDSSLKTEFVRTASGQGQGAVAVSNTDNAAVMATIENAIVTGYAGTGISVGQLTGSATSASMLQAAITGSFIDMTNSGNAGGIVGRFSSAPGQIAPARLRLADNHVNQFALPPAIALVVPADGGTPQVDLTLSGNHVDMKESAPGSGIRGQLGIVAESSSGSMCTSVTNNISHLYPVGVSPQAGGIRLTQGGSGSLSLENGAQPLAADAGTVLSGNNPAPTGSVMVTEALGSISVVPNGTCLLPGGPGEG